MEKTRMTYFVHFLTLILFCSYCYVLDSRYQRTIIELKREIQAKQSFTNERLHRRSLDGDAQDITTDHEKLSLFLQEKANITINSVIADILKKHSLLENNTFCQEVQKCCGNQKDNDVLPGEQGPPGAAGKCRLGLFYPEIRETDINVEANITDNKTFKCVFFGNPIPKVVWKTNITETKVSTILDRNNSTLTSLLHVSNIKWSDRGPIQCHATNILGISNATGRLVVHSPPIMESLQQLVYTYKGVNFTFPQCEADGYPKPSISWERGYGGLPIHSKLLSNGALEIKHVDVQDEGFYICKAKNYLGRKAQTIQLKIKCLEFAAKPSYYIKVTKSKFIMLNCSTYVYGGKPDEMQGIWYRLSNESKLDYSVTTINNTFVVRANISSSGKYVCQITNKNEKIETVTFVEFRGMLDSNIVSEKQVSALEGKMLSGKYKLCWSSKLHGMSTAKFHEFCNGKAPTISIFRISSGIVGGYTDTAWNSRTGYQRSSKSFLFDTNGNGIVTTYPVLSATHAVYSVGSYGPCFGGGHNLCMFSSNELGFVRFPSSYSYPASSRSRSNVLEAEVFYKV